jgi:Flp pilus assembly protein TadD
VFAEGALKNDPSNNEARLLLTRSLITRGELDRAEKELQRLIVELPKSPEVHSQKGRLLARKKMFAEARAAYTEALRLQPDSVEAVTGLAALEMQAGRPEVARAMVTERANAYSTPAMMMTAARTYLAGGDEPGAEQMLRQIVTKDPKYLPAYSALGQLYVRQRRLEAALVEFDALAQRDPHSVGAPTLAGMILQAQGKPDDARKRYERALDVDPAAPVAANNLAWIHATSGDLNTALQLAQTAREGLPEAPQVHDTLGLIYYRKNLLPMALRSLTYAVEKAPDEAGYHYHLGLVLAKMGDRAGARDQLTRALSLKTAFEGADEARALLKTLESQ